MPAPNVTSVQGANLLKISGITSKNGRNGTKWLNVMPLQCQVMPSRKCLKSKEKQN